MLERLHRTRCFPHEIGDLLGAVLFGKAVEHNRLLLGSQLCQRLNDNLPFLGCRRVLVR